MVKCAITAYMEQTHIFSKKYITPIYSDKIFEPNFYQVSIKFVKFNKRQSKWSDFILIISAILIFKFNINKILIKIVDFFFFRFFTLLPVKVKEEEKLIKVFSS